MAVPHAAGSYYGCLQNTGLSAPHPDGRSHASVSAPQKCPWILDIVRVKKPSRLFNQHRTTILENALDPVKDNFMWLLVFVTILLLLR
jgi:hypothetical protein